MKKCILFLIMGVLLSACTTKEQDEKIKAFWGQQFLQVAMKFAGNMPTGATLSDMDKDRVAPAGSIDQKDVQDFEEMMKQWEQEQANLNDTAEDAQPTVSKTSPNTAPVGDKNTAKARPSGKAAKPIRAYLVTSASCGWSQQLKKDGWAEQFQDKYAGQIQLITYDVTTPEGQAGYQKLMARYHRSSAGTPSLFLNGTVIEGYPLEGADKAAKRALAKSGRNLPRQSNQFIEITLEDPSGAIKGKAPLKDRKAMQKEIDKVFHDNQNTVQDIGQAFGAGIQAQAFAITTKTEKALRRQASESASLQEYLKVQRQLLKKQEQSLNQLMQNNAGMLRNVK